MPTPKRKTSATAAQLVHGIDLPHKRVPGWRWTEASAGQAEFSKKRLELYAQQLLDLGMREGDVAGLLSDLYWDSYLECAANRTFEKLMRRDLHN